jgi:hypothetical protein
MELRLTFDGDDVGRKIKQNMDKAGKQVREAMRAAASDAATEIMARGADDIQEAGNFGDRWQEALKSTIDETQRTIRVKTTMEGEPPVSYWRVFEYGAHIVPKEAQYLWLPFRGALGVDVWPRAYEGDLFYAESKKGTPLLGDRDDKDNPWRYFGLDEVTIPKKFHLREIVAQVSKELRNYYAEHMKG